MGEYHNNQIDNVLKGGDRFFRIKIMSDNDETNWMDISPAQLIKIKKLLR